MLTQCASQLRRHWVFNNQVQLLASYLPWHMLFGKFRKPLIPKTLLIPPCYVWMVLFWLYKDPHSENEIG